MTIIRFDEMHQALTRILSMRSQETADEDVYVYVGDRLVYALYDDGGTEFIRLVPEVATQLRDVILEHAA